MAEKHKKKHLHQIRTVEAHDGTFVHHHTYKNHRDDTHTEPERENVATSGTPEEAAQHTQEQFAMNEPGSEPGPPQAEAQGDEGEGAQPMMG